jgi:hypothetical protein
MMRRRRFPVQPLGARLRGAAVAALVVAGGGACSSRHARRRTLDPDFYRLDPPRGVQVDVGTRAPVVHCAFAPGGGHRRVLAYEKEPPAALWRYFVAPAWKLFGTCESTDAPDGAPTDLRVQTTRRRPAARVWLITAWDSASRGFWGQMERYAVHRGGGTVIYTFGQPADADHAADTVSVSVTAPCPPPGH